MATPEPRFPFIDRICAHLSPEELDAAHARFARVLLILADIAHDMERDEGVDSGAADKDAGAL